MSYLIRRVLAKPRLILDEMCRLYGKFASYLRRVLCKTRLIFPRINGPNGDLPCSKKPWLQEYGERAVHEFHGIKEGALENKEWLAEIH